MRAWRNPDEDMELPIWHPRHEVHLRHLDFVAHLVARRVGLQDVEDFLVGATEITPTWADTMLRPIVSQRSRRAVIAKSLANKTKKHWSDFEWALMTWNVDADTDARIVAEAAIEARDADHTPRLHASPYFDVVWGFDRSDYEQVERDDDLRLIGSDFKFHVYVKYAPAIEGFFGKSVFFPFGNRGFSSRNNNWPRLAAWYGSRQDQLNTRSSRPFRVWLRGESGLVLSDWNAEPMIVAAYKAAQDELSRVTLAVSLFYMINLMGPIDHEMLVEAQHRRSVSKRGSGMADLEVADIAATYADLFTMT